MGQVLQSETVLLQSGTVQGGTIITKWALTIVFNSFTLYLKTGPMFDCSKINAKVNVKNLQIYLYLL